MKNTFGTSVSITLFGESHGPEIGAVLDGLAPGISVDEEFIASQLSLRRPSGSISTARQEQDRFRIISGVFNGKTTGTPLCILIPNSDTKSRDYSSTRALARPGHADYTAYCKYHGCEDYRGGGHFSGRITAALVAAGAIVIPALNKKGIYIGTHISRCAGIADRGFGCIEDDIKALSSKQFGVLDDGVGERMRAEIEKAASDRDSVGGILETAVTGLPAGVGEPWFDSVEGLISHAVFSVPAVKGIEFGAGFEMADMRGSESNDPFYVDADGVKTRTNNNGGINGGITNGMPVIFRCVIKPTPSIYKTQETVDFINGENAPIEIQGRHDPAIIHRARVVIDSVTALVIADLLTGRFGTDYLTAEEN